MLDALAAKCGAEFQAKRRLTSALAEVKDDTGSVILVKPLTFMNLSGQAVAALMQSEGAKLRQLLVVADDADLELGDVRLRGQGGSGGHRGLASIIALLGSEEFARLRIGIGRRARPGEGLTEHVLGKFEKEERAIVEESVTAAVGAIECWRRDGLEKAMSQFNVKRK